MIRKCFILFFTVIIILLDNNFQQNADPLVAEETINSLKYLDEYEHELANYKPDPKYPDDAFIIITIKEAIAAKREGNGPIGVCLVREIDGKILETGHNRQNAPYFRSDMHAEMDMLTRYEDRIKMKNTINGKPVNPRIMYQGTILYSSLEPCLMCLTRIINAGIPKVYYAAFDDPRGVAKNLQCLPEYWREILEKKMKYETAKCSPRLKEIAGDIFFRSMKKAQALPEKKK